MNDSQILHDAFAEFERQADLVSASRVAAPGSTRSTRSARSTGGGYRRAYLIAATVVAVLAVATVVAVLGASGGGQDQVAGPVGSSPHSTGPDTSAPARSGASSGSLSTSPPASSSPPTSVVPANHAQMVKAFARVLGPGVTFTVTESQGNYLKGVLTVVKSGRRGGYDIQAYQGKLGDQALCEDADTSHCKVRKTAQGGSLASGYEPAAGGSGTLYLVNYVRPDGASFLMHLSTVTDPKGAGAVLGKKPPLTLKQVEAIVESDRW